MCKVLLAGMAIWVLTSCAPAPNTSRERVTASIIRWTDEKAGVTCWIYGGKAISCLPTADTLLGRE